MSPQQAVALGARFFSIFLIIWSFNIIGMAFAMSPQVKGDGSYAMFAMAMLPALAAIFLWTCPMFVAGKLVPRTRDTDIIRMPVRQIAAALTAILGLWAVAISLPDLLSETSVALYIGFRQYSGMYLDGQISQILVSVFQFVLGLFLLCKPWFVADRIDPEHTGSAATPE